MQEGGLGAIEEEQNSGAFVLKKGPWTAGEDAILVDYVQNNGEGNWNNVQKNTGLSRCGKSCRLRWANHLRPNLKKGAFTPEEERLIVELHAKLGNKWARMASQLPGRTDNEIKNYWNTRIKRRMRAGLPVYPPDVQQRQQSPDDSAELCGKRPHFDRIVNLSRLDKLKVFPQKQRRHQDGHSSSTSATSSLHQRAAFDQPLPPPPPPLPPSPAFLELLPPPNSFCFTPALVSSTPPTSPPTSTQQEQQQPSSVPFLLEQPESTTESYGSNSGASTGFLQHLEPQLQPLQEFQDWSNAEECNSLRLLDGIHGLPEWEQEEADEAERNHHHQQQPIPTIVPSFNTLVFPEDVYPFLRLEQPSAEGELLYHSPVVLSQGLMLHQQQQQLADLHNFWQPPVECIATRIWDGP